MELICNIDENIHPSKMVDILGDKELADNITKSAIALYTKASEYAATRGIIIADTKFEFGLDENNKLVLVDEVLTPGKKNVVRKKIHAKKKLTPFSIDSSRFWPASKYEAGRTQDSFDKQFVRNYLESINFDKESSIELPQNVIDDTLEKYKEAFLLLTGRNVSL